MWSAPYRWTKLVFHGEIALEIKWPILNHCLNNCFHLIIFRKNKLFFVSRCNNLFHIFQQLKDAVCFAFCPSAYVPYRWLNVLWCVPPTPLHPLLPHAPASHNVVVDVTFIMNSESSSARVCVRGGSKVPGPLCCCRIWISNQLYELFKPLMNFKHIQPCLLERYRNRTSENRCWWRVWKIAEGA